MRLRILVSALVSLLPLSSPAAAQSVLLDEGSFAVMIQGDSAGTETFTIRRSGMGNDGMILAHGVVTLELAEGSTEMRPVLQAVPADGAATQYHVQVTGANASEARIGRAGDRYVAQYSSSGGSEEREFLARPGTRILEAQVAHQYYFLRGLRQGSSTFVIEPRARRFFTLPVTSLSDDEVTLGPNTIPARRVTFGEGDDSRTVWFDDQGRVLRVEVPALGYVAQREDLAG